MWEATQEMDQDNTKLPEKFLLDKKLIDISFLTKDSLIKPNLADEPDEEWTVDSLFDELIAHFYKSRPSSCMILR